MHANPLPPLRRGGREVCVEVDRNVWLDGSRFAFTRALGLASRLALRRRISGRWLIGLSAGIIAGHGCAASLTAVGDIPPRALEDDAHRLEYPPHSTGTRWARSQRFVLEGLKLLEVSTARVTCVDVGRHNLDFLLISILIVCVYFTRSVRDNQTVGSWSFVRVLQFESSLACGSMVLHFFSCIDFSPTGRKIDTRTVIISHP